MSALETCIHLFLFRLRVQSISCHGVSIFPTAMERSSNRHSNRGGSMVDRAGRGLCTPHLLRSLFKHIVQRGLIIFWTREFLLAHISDCKLNSVTQRKGHILLKLGGTDRTKGTFRFLLIGHGIERFLFLPQSTAGDKTSFFVGN